MQEGEIMYLTRRARGVKCARGDASNYGVRQSVSQTVLILECFIQNTSGSGGGELLLTVSIFIFYLFILFLQWSV